ncbi:glycosyltransferase family 4 protein [Denitrobacterium detoxificans]|uniref:glycosyltransferase family 4 protein n=1 Tax=Denitrobacterium detoxificans TaxID=79604 RepID=UPI0026EC1823|nr:MraY family glycosyltransferase [Denitrobacterium detoxificans]MBE6465333.1 undecaprenyl/decaprenyl-phosphate alpha-N-acetylglucosaminyl 1-phosphate transferase [Denitrobacterium detoxificans]
MDFFQLGIVLLVAFVVTYIMVPVSKRIALRIGAIDYPSNRRVNTTPIPRCGGIALYVGFMAGLLVMYVQSFTCGHSWLDIIMERNVNPPLLVCGITFMFALGLVDDVRQINAKIKFAGQIVACCLIYAAGISIDAIGSPIDAEGHRLIFLHWADMPITVIYLLGFVNITNLIDGLDGLAAGIVAIVTACLMVLVAAQGSFTLTGMCLALIGACLAFLRFNFYPATVFMGDSGSLFLGLIVGIVSIMGVVRMSSLVLMLVPLVIAGVPVIDTLSAIVRRKVAHKHIDEADLGHVHHRLLDAGFSQRKAVVILYCCSGVLGAIGISIGQFTGSERWVILGVLAAALAVVIWKFKLFKPVLRHYYEHKGKEGPRMPSGYGRGEQIPEDPESGEEK